MLNVGLTKQVIGKWVGYSHKSLNNTFDMDTGKVVTQPTLDKYSNINADLSFKLELSEYFLHETNELKSYLDSIGVPLLFTFPTSIRTDNTTFTHRDDLQDRMKEEFFLFICNSSDFYYPITDFFNTNYHLNHNGAKQRTLDVVNCLKEEGVIQ